MSNNPVRNQSSTQRRRSQRLLNQNQNQNEQVGAQSLNNSRIRGRVRGNRGGSDGRSGRSGNDNGNDRVDRGGNDRVDRGGRGRGGRGRGGRSGSVGRGSRGGRGGRGGRGRGRGRGGSGGIYGADYDIGMDQIDDDDDDDDDDNNNILQARERERGRGRGRARGRGRERRQNNRRQPARSHNHNHSNIDNDDDGNDGDNDDNDNDNDDGANGDNDANVEEKQEPPRWRLGQADPEPTTYIRDAALHDKKFAKNKYVLTTRFNMMKHQHQFLSALPMYNRRKAGLDFNIEMLFSREFDWDINLDIRELSVEFFKFMFGVICERERMRFPRNLRIDGSFVPGANQAVSQDEDEDNDEDNNANNLVGLEERFRRHIGGNCERLYNLSPILGILYERWLGQYFNTENRSVLYNNLAGSQIPDLPPPYNNDNDLIPAAPAINVRTNFSPNQNQSQQNNENIEDIIIEHGQNIENDIGNGIDDDIEDGIEDVSMN